MSYMFLEDGTLTPEHRKIVMSTKYYPSPKLNKQNSLSVRLISTSTPRYDHVLMTTGYGN